MSQDRSHRFDVPAGEPPAHRLSAADVLNGIVAGLSSGLSDSLRAIVLFGSHAREDHHEDSDWDLLVIADRLGDRPLERYQSLKRMLPDDIRGLVAILAVTAEEFEGRLPEIYLDIGLDGYPVYDPTGYAKKRLAELQRIIRKSGLYRERTPAGDAWRWRDPPPPGGEWSVEWES